MTTFSKLFGQELYHNSSADIYSLCRVKFTFNTVVTESPNFINLGLPAIHASDELNPFSTPLLESESQQMYPNGERRVMFLEKLQLLE